MKLAAIVALALALGGSSVAQSAQSCSPTIPNGSPPPGETGPTPDDHGNGKLWTSFPHTGTLDWPGFVQPEGWLDVKFPWWRAVTGALRITGRRLDAEAPPLAAYIPAGYGPTGFQASGVLFPTRGCWEVTGHAGKASLTFVVLATVGRDGAPTPTARLLSPRVRRLTATIRWRGSAEAVGFDLRVRPVHGSWRVVVRRTQETMRVVRARNPGRYEVAVRAHDRWHAGPWSRPLAFRLG